MKKKKWLLIIVGILLLINLAFYVFTRVVDIDEYVEDKLSAYLEKYLEAEIQIGNFTFNDRQITITELQVKARDGSFQLETDHIFIEYNLLKLIFTQIGIQQAIKLINIYEPSLTYNYEQTNADSKVNNVSEETQNTVTDFKFPNFSKYFRKLQLHEGKMQINYHSKKLNASEFFGNIEISIDNTKNSRISFQSHSGTEKIELEAEIMKQELQNLNLQLTNFAIDSLQTALVNKADFKLDAQFLVADEILDYEFKLYNISFIRDDLPIIIENISFSGDSQNVTGEISQANISSVPVTGRFTLNSLYKEPRIDASLQVNLELGNFVAVLDGKLQSEIQVIGKLTDPHIYLQSWAKEINYNNQKIEELDLTADYYQNKANINLNSMFWQGNKFSGDGTYKVKKGLHFNLAADSLVYEFPDGRVKGNFFAALEYKQEPKLNFALENSQINWQNYEMTGFNLSGTYKQDKVWVNLSRLKRDIVMNGNVDLKAKKLSVNLGIKRFNPNSLLKKINLPVVSGNVNINADTTQVDVNSNLNLTDQDFGSFDGNIMFSLQHNLVEDSTQIKLNTNRLKYNYEPINLSVDLLGSSDSLYTQKFIINDEIEVDATIKKEQQLKYDISLTGRKIKIADYLKYFLKTYQTRSLAGTTNFNVNISKQESSKVDGKITAADVTYGNLKPLSLECDFSGDLNQINFNELKLLRPDKQPISWQANLKLDPLQYKISTSFEQLKLQDYWQDSHIKGDFDGEFRFQKKEADSRLSVILSSKNCMIGSTELDSIYVNAMQKDSLLMINKLIAKNRKEIDLKAEGSLAYNILSGSVYKDSRQLQIEYQGDLLRFLSKQTNFISYGRSDSSFRFIFGTNEDGILLDDGFLKIDKGKLTLKDQLEQLEKLKIDLQFANNTMQINNWQQFMGSGWLYIRNEIANERNFQLGNINLGQFYVRTSAEGVLVNIPNYMPSNSVANVEVRGRNSAEFVIQGPFYDIKMIGDVYISNGRAIYPPNSENLFKMFTQVTDISWSDRQKKTSKKEVKESAELPFELDLKLHFADNVRYVTYPLDLAVNPESYLHILYKEGSFDIPEAHFIAEKGSVDILGTTMEADFVQVIISRYHRGVKLSATFYKKVADGTLITLHVFNESSEGTFSVNKLRYEFSSDNAADKSLTSILARLRYGRGIDELSDTQRRALLQEEMVQIAGLGVSNAIIDPLISPIENRIRQWLRLDYFYLQTDVIQNIFQRYYSPSQTEDAYVLEAKPSSVTRSGYEMFMDNFSVGMGKYISDDVFLDYQAQFQKPEGLAFTSDMGVYHHFTVRYDLPYKFKLAYRYNILPFNENNTHEIQLQRSFRFW